MSSARNTAMADLDTQIQIVATPPNPTGPSGQALPPLNGVGKPDRTTSQYPTERQKTVLPSEPPTRIINPYLNPNDLGIVNPGVGPPPPPPKEEEGEDEEVDQAERRRQMLKQLQLAAAATAQQARANSQDTAKRVNSWLAHIPTPGDIWTPFFILLFLFLVLIPVKGHSRLMWLWLVIIGHAHIGTPNTDTSFNQPTAQSTSVGLGIGASGAIPTSTFLPPGTGGGGGGGGQGQGQGGGGGSQPPSTGKPVFPPPSGGFGFGPGGAIPLGTYMSFINGGEV